VLAAGLAAASSPALLGAEALVGSGSTFAANAIELWAAGFRAETGVVVEYDAVGSGAGIRDIKARRTVFGVSDVPLSVAELMNTDLVQFPIVIGGVVPVANLGSDDLRDLRLDGRTLASIYLGEITRWDHPAIAVLNPGRALPDLPVKPCHRAESSGTTFLFTFYLSRVSEAWEQRLGFAKTIDWPVGSAHRGNDGIASYVKRAPGALGYVEFSRVQRHGLSALRLQNRAGRWVRPSTDSFQHAASNVPWETTPAFAGVAIDSPGELAWPIAGMSFAVMPRTPSDPVAAEEVLNFFWWSFQNGGGQATAAGYVPLPSALANLVERAWSRQLKMSSGLPIWTPVGVASSAPPVGR
jgi:phosphate transport system substrate-binding protein